MRLTFIKETRDIEEKKKAREKSEAYISLLLETYIASKAYNLNEYDLFKKEKIIDAICELNKQDFEAETVLKNIFSVKMGERKQTVWHLLGNKRVAFSTF